MTVRDTKSTVLNRFEKNLLPLRCDRSGACVHRFENSNAPFYIASALEWTAQTRAIDSTGSSVNPALG